METRTDFERRRFAPLLRYRGIVDDWEAFLGALSRPLPPCVWTNTLKITPEALVSLAHAEGIDLEPLPWCPAAFRLSGGSGKPGNHWTFLAGLYHIQEEAALLPVQLLDPRPGERILDLCAAPGNKAARCAVLMENRGTVVANDRNPARMRAIQHTVERLGLLNVSTTLYDGANYPRDAGLFDKVLVDVPCTCEGTSRKSPEVLVRTPEQLGKRMSGLQKALLRKAYQLCRPGGRIVYASCTYAPEENEAVVDAILREAGPGRLRVVPVRVPGFRTSPGLVSWREEAFDPSLRHALRVWPHQNDTGGFFSVLLEKGRAGSAEGPRPRRPGPQGPEQLPPLSVEASRSAGETRPAVEYLRTRYGIDLEAPERSVVVLPRKAREFSVVCGDHLPPPRPPPAMSGLLLLRLQPREPKPTTAAAMTFGSKAVRNVVDLDREQLSGFLRRGLIPLSPQQVAGCTGEGYVLVRHRGLGFGTAYYLPAGGREGPRIRSLFPKAWVPLDDKTTRDGGEGAVEGPGGSQKREIP